VNQLRAAPLSEVGKTLQRIVSSVVYRPTCVRYTCLCSSGSVVPSYLSMTKVFHPIGNGVSIIPSIKGCLRAFFCTAEVLAVPIVWGFCALSLTVSVRCALAGM